MSLLRGVVSGTFMAANLGFKGAALTAGAISNWINDARTKKDIRRIYKEAADANYINRGVLAMPYVQCQQLLLTSTDANDNDIYVYETNSSNPGMDFIYGETEEPENIIVSGGKSNERVRALIPFIHKCQQNKIPVIALHSSNQELENMLINHSTALEIISQRDFYYDGFRALPVEDMAYLLFETMPEDTSPSAQSVLRALLEIIIRKGHVDFQTLAAFPLIKLMDTLNTLKANCEITADEFDDISRDYMAGSSEVDTVRSFLSKLNRQAESIFGRPRANTSNIKKMLNIKGVIAIDTGTSRNDAILSFIVNHLMHIQSNGKDFAIILDNIPISKHPLLCDLLQSRIYAVSNNDFISSLYGGEKDGEDLFNEITGDVPLTVLFNHRSGTSSQKWSEHLGKYHKIRIKLNITQTKGFMTGANAHGITVDETDEPRVRAETISILPDNMACINNKNNTLFAEV